LSVTHKICRCFVLKVLALTLWPDFVCQKIIELTEFGCGFLTIEVVHLHGTVLSVESVLVSTGNIICASVFFS